MDAETLAVGTRVLVAGLQGRQDLNGLHGVVCGAYDEEAGRVPVKVVLASGESESVRIKPANLQPAPPEKRIKVLRTQCTMGNTGHGGGLGELIGTIYMSRGKRNSPLAVDELTKSELDILVRERRWVEHPTELCDRFGLSLRCYAQRYRRSDEHQGRNNILATYLTNTAQTGLAPNTVLSEAIFVRLSPTTGEPVDFVWSEAVRALCYINDLMDVYPLEESCPSSAERASYYDAIRQCFPYYMANGVDDDNMRTGGFFSSDGRRECRRLSDGSLRKKPADMQPDSEFVKVV